jgi:hypothetical protein
MKARHILAALLLAAVITPAVALACLHVPHDFGAELSQTDQVALIFFDGKREELILRLSYTTHVRDETPQEVDPLQEFLESLDQPGTPIGSKTSPTTKAKTTKKKSRHDLSRLGWVVPVPTTPDHYEVESNDVFADVARLTAPQKKSIRRRAKSKSAGGSIQILAAVDVGRYRVQPIKTHGKAAGPALNAWLTTNGFGPVPSENMAYYLERNWTFLAVRIRPKSGKKLDANGALQPLRISFRTPKIVYPLKFSSHQGTFSVTLFVVTPKGLDLKRVFTHLERFDLYTDAVRRKVSLKNLSKRPMGVLWQKIVSEGRLKFRKGVINKIEGATINNNSNPIARWTEDLTIPNR